MRPNCCLTWSASAWTCCRSVTSTRIATAPGSAAAVALALASSMSVTTTVAPSAASLPAIALPMPAPAPVTIAILSFSLPIRGSSRAVVLTRPNLYSPLWAATTEGDAR